ncbi:ABC transporter ATP-binding protein [Amycolatopsis jiangsuensis]|uniref:ATP-binding cassette subfamily B protein n=1 Tax=Amycolatopsis jiangsuensis TaxID=1181879 RepID=A0A840IWI7_9PSEU|nr:ABC transporter ATP-binding protein [Amycolatopsis jiangsuensis]MBB4685795.1 ATP-binding cassette subfamily B protein [Amycolatopsis jiangsuensis]
MDKADLRLLASCVREHRGPVLVSILAGLVFQGASIVLPDLIKQGLDEGVVAGDRGSLVVWALIILGMTLVSVGGLIGMLWSAVTYSTTAAGQLRERLLEHVLTLDRAAEQFGAGDLAIRGTRDVDAVRAWLAGIASLVSGACGFVAIVVAIALLDPLLAVVGLAMVPLIAVASVFYPKRMSAVNADLSAAHGRRADAVENLLTGAESVRGLGAERVLVDAHHRDSAEVTAHTFRVARVAADWAALAPFIPAAGTAIGLAVGGPAVASGTLSIGGLVAFTTWMTMLSGWVGMLTMRFNQIVQARTAARRITEVLRTEPAVREPEQPVALPARGELELRGVDLPGDVLSERVAPGEFVAVTGPLGSGKTRLTRLLCRLDDPARGEVRYGGVDLRSAELAEVRRRITYVPQRPAMVSGTIAENLALGQPGCTLGELRAACRAAAIDAEFESFSDGYETAVGERGGTLSGGQRQRLALARGMLAGGEVLVLDDVTSAVDIATERTMLTNLRSWATETRTTVVFATHRDAVLEEADRVLTLPSRTLVPAGAVDG